MKLRAMRERLVCAELDYAHFNALRTSDLDTNAGIHRGAQAGFEYVIDSSRPQSSYYNRAVGCTAAAFDHFSDALLPAAIRALELTPDRLNPETNNKLQQYLFHPSYSLTYLGLEPRIELPVERPIIRYDESHVDDFFDLLQAEGVDLPPEKRAIKRTYYCTDEFQTYVALAPDRQAAGWATMYVHDGVAFLGNSFTLPQFRKAGIHHALLATRMNRALEMQLDMICTDVEHGSQSHDNCEQVGFRILTINSIWTRK